MAVAVRTIKPDSSEAQKNNPLGIGSFFTEEQFSMMQEIMYPKYISAGNHLFWEGDPLGKLYYIRSGKIKLLKSTEDGKQFILSILQAGDLLHEPADGFRQHHSFSAEIIENAELGVIQAKDLDSLMHRQGDLAFSFMNWMAFMQRVTESKFRDLLLFGKPGALASTLIRLTNTYGVATPDGIRINLKLTNAELADFIGATRESINRMLSTLKAEGTLSIRKGYIVVECLDALRTMSQCPTCSACPKGICRI
ncbi:Crp/Fnr family transcriptional regulator [Paenibacillus baekrokdamisoli]|uniref:Crp/Fnr family transcriptional regulator n=1 Tax=Paenibacillus baekrokdamisoli TaxID=1712516 RepID=A0A3G9JGM7_9BACL|nr:Crp/Fnr family transcriptional regulator [Paenibacillus baekrokdamisoli]MBB3071884.1 CRP/FNR family transcriptional regulator [Paenibacillus baekrokdamisoli]BBH24133.1 Crp/Fnr family transcriptional regulator [Paenibacillus baekrokdamisoli]